MDNLFLFILLIGLIVGLVTSAKIVESAFIRFSTRFRINEFFLGFFVLAIVTSLPEISIAVVSSSESPELSLGNLMGATIVILTLILGISAVKYKGIEFRGKFSEKEVILGLITIALMIVVISDGVLTIAESVGLVGFYSFYIYYIYRKFNKKDSAITLFVTLDNSSTIKLFLKGLIGVAGILIFSSYIVSTAESIAINIGISQTLIGILMLAVGTNLPELTLLLTSHKLEEQELAVGSFFGSACLNVATLGLLGITSRGFIIDGFLSVVSGSVILAFALILFFLFSWSGRRLSRAEGILLISTYVAFLVTEILILISIIQ